MSRLTDLDSPDGFIQRVVEFKAEAILLGWSLNQLACTQQDRAHPVIRFGGLVDQQHAWLQAAPQLRPALQGATDLRVLRDGEWTSKFSTTAFIL